MIDLNEHPPCQWPTDAKWPLSLICSGRRGAGAGKNYRVVRRTYNVERITGDLKKLQGRGDRGLFGERPKGWRLSVPPAIGHDTERLDEALPAARERDGHAEIDNLVC